ncbi:MAG: hypothetical protein H6729_08355 [Deltaproteobacteria bacterium]|nr:hypothetical protein [Deltaproteobacteria bacterium]
MLKIPRRITRWLRHPATVVTAAQLAYRLGKEFHSVYRGAIDGREFRARMGNHFGTISGGLAGAWVGAAAGTALAPGVGTAAGAIMGGLMGETAGGKAMRVAVERVESIRSGGQRDAADNHARFRRPRRTM